MREINNQELNDRIRTFLDKKFAEHPELLEHGGLWEGVKWHSITILWRSFADRAIIGKNYRPTL